MKEMKMKKSNKAEEIELKPLKKKTIRLKIKGTTNLLMEKMDMDVVEAYNKKKAKKMVDKDERLEEDKIGDKIHYTEDGNIGFPVSGFAKGIVEVAPYIEGLDKKMVRGSIRILGNIVPINYKKQTINVAWGKSSGITKAPRKIVRPEFHDWSCTLDVMFNESNISIEQIVNLFNWAGFQQGLGSWRPEKSGSFGQYEVVIDGKKK
jgi:hypothetical protein